MGTFHHKDAYDRKLVKFMEVAEELLALAHESFNCNSIVNEHDGIRVTIEKPSKYEDNDVFGVLSNAKDGSREIVILKSKAKDQCMYGDGMTEEEFEEHWSYNIEGSKGKYSYSVVDDTLYQDMLEEMIDNDEDLINPPYIED